MKTLLKFFAVAALLLTFACAGKIPELEKAQLMYDQAAKDPRVVKYAPADLEKARLALENANSSFGSDEKKLQAYITQRRVEIANLQAERNANLEKIQASQADLNQAVEGKMTKIANLERELADIKSQPTGRGLEITLRDETTFETGKAQLKPECKITLNKISKVLKRDPNRQAIIEGHTDAVGKPDYNLNLSQQRAEAVVAYLVANGVKRENLLPKGYGAEFPLSRNATAEGRQNNRRVEVILTPTGKKAEAFVR